MSSTPAGWYPDPQAPFTIRWWDGSRWTEHAYNDVRRGQERPSTATGSPNISSTPHGQVPPPPPSAPTQGAPINLARRPGVFGKGKALDEAHAEIARLQAEMARLGVLDILQAQAERDRLAGEVTAQQQALDAERQRFAAAVAAQNADYNRQQSDLQRLRGELEQQIAMLRAQVVETEELAILQEAGVYRYHHPLDDSVAYRAELDRIRDQIKTMVKKDGGAIWAATDWHVNGSLAQGRKMVRDFSKLMLRAYNAEADNAVRSLKPYKVAASKERLDKVAQTIVNLGKTMSIVVAPQYHALRLRELELTADYLEMLAEEKERQREERERLREERLAEQEIARERERLRKEQKHFQQAIATLLAQGDTEGAARLQAQLATVEDQIENVDFRAGTLTAGHVYVISNIGSFGEGVLKIGMTRRLDPMDRVRELGDASVPFIFDVHALYFAENAVKIEREMHQLFADRRVNRVNNRKEFFRVTPAEAREALVRLSGELMTFVEVPEAVDYRQGLAGATERVA
ncbi:MAG: chromosome segregation ATPase [Nocardioides sp.]|nr:chromosome segregation ATPase [Nocardioides sp.]